MGSIRAFFEHHPEATLARAHQWATDPDEHVRRLVSEGSRPRLPWAPRLRAFVDDPSPVIELLERLKDRYKAEVSRHEPRIPYLETLKNSVEVHARHKKQSGGRGQFADVHLRFEPQPRGAGFEFVDYSDLHFRADDELVYEVGRRSVTGNTDRFTFRFRKP